MMYARSTTYLTARMQLDEYHVLMPRARRHPVITKWTAAKLHATYSGDALITHLAAHADRLLRLAQGGGDSRGDHRFFICTFDRAPYDDIMREHQAHIPLIPEELWKPLQLDDSDVWLWGVEAAMRLWNMGLESACVEHLVESKQRIQWIVQELWDVERKIYDVMGHRVDWQAEVVTPYFEYVDDIPPEPPTAERPLHLHVSEHPAGGGITDLFHQRLIMCTVWLSWGGVGCPGWWITSCEDNVCEARYSTRGYASMKRFADRPVEYVRDLASVLYAAHCLENLVIPEINAMLHELNGWRKCAAGLALHERVGKDSALYALGPDVLRMVLRWM